jgi:hypothetical protein
LHNEELDSFLNYTVTKIRSRLLCTYYGVKTERLRTNQSIMNDIGAAEQVRIAAAAAAAVAAGQDVWK